MKKLLYLGSGLLMGSAAWGASCGDLAKVSLPDAKITSAQVVEAGTLQAPGNQRAKGPNPYANLPAFCRVAATLTPSSDSDIKIEVWLPVANWNQKLQSVGNGGWAGVISYSAMADAVREGYASASTDTGHVGGSGSFALGHPEKLIDFGWRSEHEMTVKAKALVKAFYGNGPKLTYWNGCSTGGRQGLKEAQMFPNDYDGIIAGAPANRTAISLWIAFAVLKDKDTYIPPEKYPAIHAAALAACDAKDGLKDGLIGDPTKCNFDPKSMLCKGADDSSLPDRSASRSREENLFARQESAHGARSCSRRWFQAANSVGGFKQKDPILRRTSTTSIFTLSIRTPIGIGAASISTKGLPRARSRRTSS